MLEMIMMIPENVGWAMVGAAALGCAIMFYKLGQTIVEAIKERLTDEEEEEA